MQPEKDLEAAIQPRNSQSSTIANKENLGIESPIPSKDVEAPPAMTKLDWESIDDPLNPMNWPVGKKVFHTVFPAFYGFIMYVFCVAFLTITNRYQYSRNVCLHPSYTYHHADIPC